MSKAKSFDEYIGINEGLFGNLTSNNWSPKSRGVDRPGYPTTDEDLPKFKSEFPGFSTEPDKEISDVEKDNYKINKQLADLLGRRMTNDLHVLEMMEQKKIVTGTTENDRYIEIYRKWLKELESVEFQVRKGVI